MPHGEFVGVSDVGAVLQRKPWQTPMIDDASIKKFTESKGADVLEAGSPTLIKNGS